MYRLFRFFIAGVCIVLLPGTDYSLCAQQRNAGGRVINIVVGGSTGTIYPLLGVISGPIPPADSPSPDLTRHLQDIGITSIRNNDYFDDRGDIEQIFDCGGAVYPSWDGDPYDKGNYHWEKTDELFQSWMDGGFEPFLRLGGEVQCAIQRHMFKGPQNERQEDNWIIAAKKTVQRYNNWNGRKDVLEYVDIWTEWPNKKFYDGPKKKFIKFWAKAYADLKKTFPKIKFGGPGFLPAAVIRVISGRDGPARQFLGYLYSKRIKPDWIGWHLWQNDPQKFIDAERNFRHLLEGTGPYADVPWAGTGFFHDVETIVDAYGVSKVENTSLGMPKKLSIDKLDKLYNHRRGSALLTGIWIALQHAGIKRAYYYRSGDPFPYNGGSHADVENTSNMEYPVNSRRERPPFFGKKTGRTHLKPEFNCGRRGRGGSSERKPMHRMTTEERLRNSPPGSGLFYGNKEGTYKPIAYAVRLWSKLVNEFPVKSAVPPCAAGTAGDRLWILAGKSGAGSYAILAANPGRQSIRWQAQLPKPGGYTIEVYQVDDINDGMSAVQQDSPVITTPSETCQLVVYKVKAGQNS